jgi:ketosteroid isomerase-like protein
LLVKPTLGRQSIEGDAEVEMKILGLILVVVAAVLLLGYGAAHGVEQSPQPTITIPPDLARILTDYEKAWRAKDEKALAALFTEDGFVLSSGMPPVRGRKQIEQRYKDSGGPLALRALAFATDGALGYIIGGFARNSDDPDIGKFTLTLRKGSDGRWMIMSDMDNANQR